MARPPAAQHAAARRRPDRRTQRSRTRAPRSGRARLSDDAPLRLEQDSRDTLQNLRNARIVLGDGMRSRVTLLSSRYHLARCAWFARHLGYDWELCAAEPRLELGPRMLLRLAGEAAYVCMSDIGARWAKLTGNRRMLSRLT
ncbi:ElyC/SanA/YdcF family protein [Lysobacter capsici]|uniref:ElyC/SanA/YdcF family protein n=1 Tax=Lysobacter capsici TaxID=435897 RepID=UPI00398D56A2